MPDVREFFGNKQNNTIHNKTNVRNETIYQKDLEFGLSNEDIQQVALEKHFNCKFQQTDRYSFVDYINSEKKIIIELKSRRCGRYTYNTTIIGYDKVEYCLKKIEEGYDIYFFFYFEKDKTLCKYQFTKENHNPNWIRFTGRMNRGKDERKNYYDVPTKDLIQI